MSSTAPDSPQAENIVLIHGMWMTPHSWQGWVEVTESKEYPGRTHFTAGMAGWEEVADYALNWAREHAQKPERSEVETPA